jgi:hypothetical protein
MATVIFKKSAPISIAATASIPAYRTREQARGFAGAMRSKGVQPTAPAKNESGWQVKPKHVGGTLSIKRG